MKIICVLILITCGKIPFATKVETDGKLIKETKTSYYVDFSESKTTKKYCSGEINKKLIKKDLCVKE